MENPLVSIIIPTYNRSNYLDKTLESILSQTYNNWECLIIDDGSTDNTREIVSNYSNLDKRFKYFIRPEPFKSGGNGARNYGFKISQGELIQWFDDDDIMLTTFLEVKVKKMFPETLFTICNGFYWDPILNEKEKIPFYKTKNLFKDYLMWRTQVMTPSVLFKKAFLLKHDLFNEKIHRGQENELFSRLFFRQNTDAYGIIDLPLFLYRQHAGSKTGRDFKYVPDYKYSLIFNSLNNLNRSITIKDPILMNYFYKALISLFARAVINNDIKNARFVYEELGVKLLKLKKIFGFKFYILGWFVLKFKQGAVVFSKHFRNKKIA